MSTPRLAAWPGPTRLQDEYFCKGHGHTRDGSALAPRAAEAVLLDALSGNKRARLVAVGPDNAPAFTGTTTAPATLPDGVPLTAGPHAVRFVGSEETASVRLRVAGSPSGDVRVDGPAGLISVDPAVGAWLEWTADGGIQLTPRP